MDFPLTGAPDPQRSIISTWGTHCLVAEISLAQNLNSSAAAVWPAANRAIYVPIWIEQLCTGRRIAVNPSVQSGNLDVGLYDQKGNRIVSKGSTAVGAAGATQIIDITASVTGTASPVLTPGTYFLALCVDNIVASFKQANLLAVGCQICGVQQQAVGAVTLPNPATFANPASGYVPLMALVTAGVM